MSEHSDNTNLESSDFPNIGKVARRELANAGYTRLEQLTNVSEKELLRIHGVGPKAIRILREALGARGLAFASSERQEK
jgi:predicted flap endonuclease-1-like 5' DNA nuclease